MTRAIRGREGGSKVIYVHSEKTSVRVGVYVETGE